MDRLVCPSITSLGAQNLNRTHGRYRAICPLPDLPSAPSAASRLLFLGRVPGDHLFYRQLLLLQSPHHRTLPAIAGGLYAAEIPAGAVARFCQARSTGQLREIPTLAYSVDRASLLRGHRHFPDPIRIHVPFSLALAASNGGGL